MSKCFFTLHQTINRFTQPDSAVFLSQLLTQVKHFITALHVMQTRYSEENSVRPSVRLSVRPSVRPSVTRAIPDKTKERSVQIFIPYERTFILVF